MKILISYFSQSGNTEKVAKSMKEALEDEHDVTMRKVTETDPAILQSYDIVFLGSGIYAGKIHKTVLDLIKNAETLPPKFVLFNTHASLTGYQGGFKMVKKQMEEANSEIIGEWDCRGENIGLPKEMIQQRMAGLPPDERKKAEDDLKALKGRPIAEDLAHARAFAKSIVK